MQLLRLRSFCVLQLKPNKTDHTGLTNLHRACEVGDLAQVKYLISIGANVNKTSNRLHSLTTPLIFAATHGHHSIVSVLIKAGAEVDTGDLQGNTPLFKAASYGHTECVERLLNAGANPNVKNRYDTICIQYAALQGHCDVVKMLLQHGADVNAKSERNEPFPLIAASMRGHVTVVEEMLKYNPQLNNVYEESHYTALYAASLSFMMSLYELQDSSLQLSCITNLIMKGSKLSSKCLDVARIHFMGSFSKRKDYVLFFRLLVRAFAYNSSDAECVQYYRKLFQHATRLGTFKWRFVQLLISAGFTPSSQQLNSLAQHFTGDEKTALDKFVTTPRSLQDQAVVVVRTQLQANVMCSLTHLEIPDHIKDYITLINLTDI